MVVLDTNMVSELRKIRLGRADAHVARWTDSVDAADLYLSEITIQEREISVLSVEQRNSAQGAILRSWMISQVLPAFANHSSKDRFVTGIAILWRNLKDSHHRGTEALRRPVNAHLCSYLWASAPLW
jgi:predicted nucleic acid-binding protein